MYIVHQASRHLKSTDPQDEVGWILGNPVYLDSLLSYDLDGQYKPNAGRIMDSNLITEVAERATFKFVFGPMHTIEITVYESTVHNRRPLSAKREYLKASVHLQRS